MGLEARDKEEEMRTYGEGSGAGIKADMDFVDEIGGIAYAHEGAARIDVVLPAIEFLVVLQGYVVSLFFGLQQ